jgi:glucokinase
MTGWRIVCDVGGTHIRTARCGGSQGPADIVVSSTAAGDDLGKLLVRYAQSLGEVEAVQEIAVAAAGPVEEGQVQLTNAALSISEATIREAFSVPPRVRVVNDLEAVAWALPWLAGTQRVAMRTPPDALSGNLLVVNVGTGFGAAMLAKTRDGWQSIACEPGHMKLASGLSQPAGALCFDASVEDLLSGQAFQDTIAFSKFAASGDAIAFEDGMRDPFACLSSSAEGRDVIRRITLLLGQVCGDLVLATGAWGGVYLCGGVTRALLQHADAADFIATFDHKGPMAQRMARVNISQIVEPYPALTGLCHLPV